MTCIALKYIDMKRNCISDDFTFSKCRCCAAGWRRRDAAELTALRAWAGAGQRVGQGRAAGCTSAQHGLLSESHGAAIRVTGRRSESRDGDPCHQAAIRVIGRRSESHGDCRGSTHGYRARAGDPSQIRVRGRCPRGCRSAWGWRVRVPTRRSALPARRRARTLPENLWESCPGSAGGDWECLR